jgi:8-oxo-dGTP diphosphatase
MARTVCVLILYSRDKRILLQHRDDVAPVFPNHWAFFGGSVDPGETLDEAVKRETFEEISYVLQNPKLLTSGEMSGESADGTFYKNAEGKMYIYAEEYDEIQKLILHEGDDMKWFKFSEIDGLKMVPHDKRFLKLLEKKILSL